MKTFAFQLLLISLISLFAQSEPTDILTEIFNRYDNQYNQAKNGMYLDGHVTCIINREEEEVIENSKLSRPANLITTRSFYLSERISNNDNYERSIDGVVFSIKHNHSDTYAKFDNKRTCLTNTFAFYQNNTDKFSQLKISNSLDFVKNVKDFSALRSLFFVAAFSPSEFVDHIILVPENIIEMNIDDEGLFKFSILHPSGYNWNLDIRMFGEKIAIPYTKHTDPNGNLLWERTIDIDEDGTPSKITLSTFVEKKHNQKVEYYKRYFYEFNLNSIQIPYTFSLKSSNLVSEIPEGFLFENAIEKYILKMGDPDSFERLK